MKQVVWGGFTRDVLTAVVNLQRKMGTVPIVAPSEVEIEIVHLLGKGPLHVRMLHQELVEKSGTTLLRSDNDKVRQRSYRAGSQSANVPGGSVGFLDTSLHNPRFLY